MESETRRETFLFLLRSMTSVTVMAVELDLGRLSEQNYIYRLVCIFHRVVPSGNNWTINLNLLFSRYTAL